MRMKCSHFRGGQLVLVITFGCESEGLKEVEMGKAQENGRPGISLFMQVRTEVPVHKLRWRGGRESSGRGGECRAGRDLQGGDDTEAVLKAVLK